MKYNILFAIIPSLILMNSCQKASTDGSSVRSMASGGLPDLPSTSTNPITNPITTTSTNPINPANPAITPISEVIKCDSTATNTDEDSRFSCLLKLKIYGIYARKNALNLEGIPKAIQLPRNKLLDDTFAFLGEMFKYYGLGVTPGTQIADFPSKPNYAAAIRVLHFKALEYITHDEIIAKEAEVRNIVNAINAFADGKEIDWDGNPNGKDYEQLPNHSQNRNLFLPTLPADMSYDIYKEKIKEYANKAFFDIKDVLEGSKKHVYDILTNRYETKISQGTSNINDEVIEEVSGTGYIVTKPFDNIDLSWTADFDKGHEHFIDVITTDDDGKTIKEDIQNCIDNNTFKGLKESIFKFEGYCYKDNVKNTKVEGNIKFFRFCTVFAKPGVENPKIECQVTENYKKSNPGQDNTANFVKIEQKNLGAGKKPMDIIVDLKIDRNKYKFALRLVPKKWPKTPKDDFERQHGFICMSERYLGESIVSKTIWINNDNVYHYKLNNVCIDDNKEYAVNTVERFELCYIPILNNDWTKNYECIESGTGLHSATIDAYFHFKK